MEWCLWFWVDFVMNLSLFYLFLWKTERKLSSIHCFEKWVYFVSEYWVESRSWKPKKRAAGQTRAAEKSIVSCACANSNCAIK